MNKFEAALEFIFLTNWSWEGAGSENRKSLPAGVIAREILGFEPLPPGWPSDAEYQRRILLSESIRNEII